MRLANRTGKVISVGRLVLALFIVGATLPELDGQVEFPRATVALGTAYLAFSALMLLLTRSTWWLDHKLRLPAHLIDLGFFLALNVATGLMVASPFFGFFVFLVLSAAARWGWRAGMLTGAAVALLLAGETAVEIYRNSLSDRDFLFAVVRAGNVIVLTFLLSWFGMTHLAGRLVLARSLPKVLTPRAPTEAAARHFAEYLHAQRIVLVWTEPEEPWLNLTTWTAEGGAETERAAPDEFPALVSARLAGRTFLFDLARKRALVPDQRRLQAVPDCVAVDAALAARVGLTEGIATPLESEDFHGYIFATGIADLCWDDLAIARKAGLDIAQLFDRWEANRSAAEFSESETRLRVARDLHDSVEQILAGIGLKLRAVRIGAPDEARRDAELKAIEADLIGYQQQVHGFIENLRRPLGSGIRVDLEGRLNDIAVALRRQWPVEIDITGDHLVPVSDFLAAEIGHLVREAVSNAVRHGEAARVHIAAEIVDQCLCLQIRDNGTGFPEAGRFEHAALVDAGFGPRSIIGRVQGLGGTVSLVSDATGALVSIKVPTGTNTP